MALLAASKAARRAICHGPLGGATVDPVVVVVWSGFPPPVVTCVFVVTDTDGIKARTGAVTVLTIVFAGLCAVYLCPVIIPELNVYVSWGSDKKSR